MILRAALTRQKCTMKGGKDISASVNDSVYLAPRHYGFTLQSRPIDGNFIIQIT